MRIVILIFLIFIAWKAESYQLTVGNYVRIDGVQFNGNSSEIIYKSKILLSSFSTLVISINGINYDNYQFSIMQAHCLHHNVTMSLDNNYGRKISQFGTNIGFLLKTNESRRVFRLDNNNYDEVHCLVALIAYSKMSPFPGNCAVERSSTNIEMIKLVEEPNYLTAIIPAANEASRSCEDSELTYETYYTYIDMLNFGVDAYFDGIEKMLFDSIFTTYQTKYVPLYNRHLLERIPGRGVIVNTVIKGKNGEMSFYVPVASYSCPPNTWSIHCADNNFVKRGISIVLIIFSIVMILNLMAPEFIESILNGMLFGGFGTILFIKSFNIEMQTFDYFITVIIGAFFVSALFGIVTLYLAIGRYVTKFTFSVFVVIFVMEIFFDNITSAYLQLIMASILSIILSFAPITCSVFLGCLLLILNVSYLSQIGNLHRIVMNNYLAITLPPQSIHETYFDFIRPNYINYKVCLNIADYLMIVFYVVISIFFTIRKEKFFFGHPALLQPDPIFTESQDVRTYNYQIARKRRDECIVGIKRENEEGTYRVVSRCRRHLPLRANVVNERSPLITHWLATSDDDHESFHTPPETSSNPNRVRIRVSSDSFDRIDVLGSHDL